MFAVSSRREDESVSLDTLRRSNEEIAANRALPKGRGLLAYIFAKFFYRVYGHARKIWLRFGSKSPRPNGSLIVSQSLKT